jgi:hypothetical protein
MKKNLKRDLAFAAIAVAIVGVLLLAPPESTIRVPDDDSHRELAALQERQGKKATEEVCRTCHNDTDLPLSKDHPPKHRCLFCHKFSEQKKPAGSR